MNQQCPSCLSSSFKTVTPFSCAFCSEMVHLNYHGDEKLDVYFHVPVVHYVAAVQGESTANVFYRTPPR